MGFSEKVQVEMGLEPEGKKWVIAGIPLRAPLKPIYIKSSVEKEIEGDCDDQPTTPKGEDSRIKTGLTCPPAPMKRKASLKFNYGGGVRQFFTPPDLESVFIRHVVERAN